MHDILVIAKLNFVKCVCSV